MEVKKKEQEKERQNLRRLPSFKGTHKDKNFDMSVVLRKIYRRGIMMFSDGGKWKQVLLILTNDHLIIDSSVVIKYNFFILLSLIFFLKKSKC